MTRLYNILRALAVSVLAVAVIVPVMLYIVLSIGAVQRELCKVGEKELSGLLGADVTIGELSVSPFNKVLLKDVSVIVAPGDTALQVERLGAGVVLGKLFFDRRIVFSYAEIIGLDARLRRDSAGAPLNIQPIIDKLSPKDKNKPPTRYDLRVNNIVIRRSGISYDVAASPVTHGKFNPDHIKIYGLKADLLLPRIKNDDYVVNLNRLALREQSGLSVESLGGLFMISDSLLAVKDFSLELPQSRILTDDINMSYQGWNDLSANILRLPFSFKLLDGTVVTPSDFKGFLPMLANFNQHIDTRVDIAGSINDFDVNQVSMQSSDGLFSLEFAGRLSGLPSIKDIDAEVGDLSLDVEGTRAAGLLSGLVNVSPTVVKMLGNMGRIRLSGEAAGNINRAFYNGTILTSAGNLDLNATYSSKGGASPRHFEGEVVIEDLALGNITGDSRLGTLTAHINADTEIRRSSVYGKINAVVDDFDYRNYNYKNITAEVDIDDKMLSGIMSIEDDNIRLSVDGNVDITPGKTDCDVRATLRDFSPAALNLTDKYAGYRMSADMMIDMHGENIENLDGRAEINRFAFKNEGEEGIELPHFVLMSSGSTSPQYILVHSDILDAQLKGHYRFKDIVPAAKCILADVMPVLFPRKDNEHKRPLPEYLVDFALELDIKGNETTNSWLQFFKSPVKILHPISLDATMDNEEHTMKLTVDAPYLLQKDKFIDNTKLLMAIDGTENSADIFLSTLYPTKKGNATLEFTGHGLSDRIDTRISWDIDREKEFAGVLDLSTLLSRQDYDGTLGVDVDIRKSRLVFNDTAWIVHPASVSWSDKRLLVNDIDISRTGQFIRISGAASSNPLDVLCIDLRDVSLDYVFETLDISNVMFGGVATGTFFASELFTKDPRLSIQGLKVKGLSYNHSLLGDADIKSAWDNETKGVTIDAVISQSNGRKSYIDGAIYPIAQSLDFRFKADKLDVGFMKPYMEAFTSEISGYASGDARLFGTFKLIDMTGDIYAEDLKMKLDFTNTYYTTSDSIHLSPGRIAFGDVVLHDIYGNTASLDGWVTHKCFKEPEFEFNITNARNFLCFDINEKLSPDWYGHIFCNGVAHVKGVPGFIDINVDMSTAPQSVFTFVLSDTEAADEYTFMTFHDRDELKGELLLSVEDPQKAAVNRLKEYYARLNREESSPTLYRINLQVNATPDGELVLVMDPVGGDRIKARGNGNLRIEYNSADEDMRMFGTYALSQGSYNFTLQDIIIKDFTIKPGSSISFHGDPLAAMLDIEAVYSVNANLSDLDESFLQDRELNRTNVPVHALLKVSGDMQQPDISFDLEFPTLTQDTYRKVKSIVSTDEMMNRQIIYLLALNRFYTPDYMASTTKGNELVSVASSTISSQLSSMLGQLSDNWSIAPNIRSDKGDFSDMEVDLALSSYLLNNRLLFNGNFGYRDKALNNNSFIGDFDLEYLLNKSGNIRLKAYNRYNDQNYYVKSALTTQGVGIMFRRDFDDIFSFIKRLRKKEKNVVALPVDSTNINIDNDILKHD